jgi:hypothetical protein
MMKNEFLKNDEIMLGFSWYTREKAPRRLSAFKNHLKSSTVGGEGNYHFTTFDHFS